MSSTLTSALQAFLAADAPLTALMVGGVWIDPAPEGVTEPFCVIELVTGTDQGYGGGPRITGATYEVAALAPVADVSTARTAADRVDALLDYAALTLDGHAVLGVRRVAPVDETLEEITGRWVRVGGEYELFVEVA